jgi:hypothetical protein
MTTPHGLATVATGMKPTVGFPAIVSRRYCSTRFRSERAARLDPPVEHTHNGAAAGRFRPSALQTIDFRAGCGRFGVLRLVVAFFFKGCRWANHVRVHQYGTKEIQSDDEPSHSTIWWRQKAAPSVLDFLSVSQLESELKWSTPTFDWTIKLPW